MTAKVEVIYFPKPCPHCKEMLFRVTKMHAAWSECRNQECAFLLNQTQPRPNRTLVIWEPTPYIECYNRR